MLDRTSRRLLLAAALIAFAAAFALTLRAGRGELATTHVTVLPAERVLTPSPPLLPDRDPFEVPADAPVDEPASKPSAPPHALPTMPVAVPPIRVLAVVTGSDPGAIVDDGSGPRLVRIDDRVGTVLLTAIDDSGISLSDGRHLAIGRDGATRR